jgi:hypothetical protein
MKSLIYKDIKGATRADNHYLETGHKINVSTQSTAYNRKIEVIKIYKCEKCSFESRSGELYEVWEYVI